MSLFTEENLPPEVRHQLKAHWVATLVVGVLLAIAGGFAINTAFFSTLTTVVVIGFAMMVAGFAEVFHAFVMRSWSHFFWLLLGGGLYILGGALVVRNPILAASFITLLLGASLIASGLIRSYIAFQIPAGGTKGFLVLSGVLTLVVGALIVAQWPGSSLWVIGLILGVELLFAGMGWVGVALSMRAA